LKNAPTPQNIDDFYKTKMSEHNDYGHIYERSQNMPAWDYLGARLLKVSAGFAQVALPFRVEMSNSWGTLQAGFITAIADAAGGYALLTISQPHTLVTTIELKINFLRPISEDVTAEGKIIHLGASIGTSSLRVKLPDGKDAAFGIGTYLLKA
jgi:acyl-CoA thioesterase